MGPRASCMAASPSVSLQVATGGRENPLKLWDGNNTATPLFTAKNVSPPTLSVRHEFLVLSLFRYVLTNWTCKYLCGTTRWCLPLTVVHSPYWSLEPGMGM